MALASVAAPKPVRAEQFVVVDETYTATAQNTDDSHYRVSPRAGTPRNWRSPIDYASGRAHARLEVIEKPSSRKTLYNICYEATPSYACMAYSPPYTAPGVYDFEFPFSTFYQYSMVDWSKGVRQIALILKDENEAKKQGDPAFYPTKIHITITIVAPGSTYVPPQAMVDGGVEMDAATPPSDAGAVVDAGVSEAGLPGAGTGTGSGGVSGTTAWGKAGSGGRISVGAGAGGVASAGITGARAASGTGGVGATPAAAPPATPPSSANASGTGCGVARPLASRLVRDDRSQQQLLSLWLATSLLLFFRASARRRPRTQGDIYG